MKCCDKSLSLSYKSKLRPDNVKQPGVARTLQQREDSEKMSQYAQARNHLRGATRSCACGSKESSFIRYACYSIARSARNFLIRCVGAGNGTRLPLEKSAGLNSSGTLSCRTEQFLYRRTMTSMPPCYPLHVMEQTFPLLQPHFENPWKYSMQVCATLDWMKLMNAYPNDTRVPKSVGK